MSESNSERRDYALATLAIHAGQSPDPSTGAVMPPIYATSTYAQSSPGEHQGFEYSRTHNPTRFAYERCVAGLEGGTRGFAFASGMAATATLLELLDSGDHVIAMDDLYGGSYRLFERVRTRSAGLSFSYVDMTDPAAFEAAITEKTRCVVIESIVNPTGLVVDVPAAIAALHQVGIPVLFNFGAEADLADLNRHLGYFVQGGLGLPDPAYYSRGDAETQQIVSQYTQYVRNILALTGTAEDRLDAETELVLELERRIAAASRPLADVRDPRTQYALVNTADLAKQYRRLQLGEFLTAQGVQSEQVSLANPALFAQLDTLVGALKPEQWKAYLRFHIGDAMAPYLSKSFRDAEFDFHGRILRGESAQPSRQQLVLGAINRAAGPMLAREYVARHLPEPTRARAELVSGQVRDALARSIERSAWMSDAAKTEAAAKLAKLRIQIGAPVEDIDYTVQPMGRASFGSNMLIASTWRHAQEMRRIGRPDVARRWDLLPQNPALAYDAAQNRLIVTAAVLQAPVLDMATDGASHYGTFGALVGHELSRAVDVKGKFVDSNETVRTWWTPADDAAWLQATDRLVTQYNAYPYPGLTGVNVNGALTRDENAADLAGVELAWDALLRANPELAKDGREAFFRGWAQMWRQQSAVDTATRAAATSVQAPGQWRANGPVSNLPAYSETFACKAADAMVRKAEDQVSIWR